MVRKEQRTPTNHILIQPEPPPLHPPPPPHFFLLRWFAQLESELDHEIVGEPAGGAENDEHAGGFSMHRALPPKSHHHAGVRYRYHYHATTVSPLVGRALAKWQDLHMRTDHLRPKADGPLKAAVEGAGVKAGVGGEWGGDQERVGYVKRCGVHIALCARFYQEGS
jgi:hypothetical protein